MVLSNISEGPNSSFFNNQPIGSRCASSDSAPGLQPVVSDSTYGDSLCPGVSLLECDVAIFDTAPPDYRRKHDPLTAVFESPVRRLPSHSIAYRIGKRIFDLALTILIAPVAGALMALIAGLIAVTSGGPVFYRQSRIGQHGRKFKIIKFRTMHARSDRLLHKFLESNAEARQEWLRSHKLQRDPRVTAIGRWLRKTSLDELPQILNVLRGEMSFVGPRPIVHIEREKYGDRFGFYSAVVPGITGLWQISGRNDVAYDDRVALDEWYARNWTLRSDLAILCRTPGAVCRGRGAY
jgi:lipopolysaccharide/colanic/teichoic acid biosynthesis glycosyltransferase